MMKDLARPSLLLAEANRRHPGLWRLLDARRMTRKDTGPDWCFIPISEVIAGLPIDGRDEKALVKAASIGAYLTALYIWRVTQGIYQIDPDVMDALGTMPVDEDIPDAVLYRLPEWCLHIDFSHVNGDQCKTHGFFVHLEYDLVTKETELRFIAHTDEQRAAIPIHLGCGSLSKALARAKSVALNNARRLGIGSAIDNDDKEYWERFQQAVGAWLNFTLYLASTNADYNGPAPARSEPKPIKTKKGLRYFPPDQPKIWDVGLREGAALRAAKARLTHAGSSETTGSRAPVRPHIRRAHWHLYRVGTGRSGQALKWIAPTLVGGGTPEDRPAVIRHV